MLLFSLSGFGESEVYEDELLNRDGLVYKPRSLEPFTGKNVLWYRNSQLLRKGSYRDGKENGQLWAKGSYKDGKEDGLWECYEECYEKDGSVSEDYPKCYQNGKEVNLSICKQ